MNSKLSVIIMAAGKGTRMKSEIPKVLHKLSGDTLLNHVIKSAEELSPDKIIIIIGYQAELVKKTISSDDILYSLQENQYGTGHAVMQAKPHLKDFKGNTLILSGDVPLIKASTLSSLINKHESGNYDELTESLIYLYNNDDLRKKLEKAARRFAVKKFSIQKLKKPYLEYYKSFMN